jgi:hypothetical protein
MSTPQGSPFRCETEQVDMPDFVTLLFHSLGQIVDLPICDFEKVFAFSKVLKVGVRHPIKPASMMNGT